MMGGGFFFWPILLLILVGVVVWVIVDRSRDRGGTTGSGPPRRSTSGRSAEDILDERFARGEIDQREYDERRRALGD